MIQKEIEVNLKTGLQARPAALFVQEANRFSSDIFIEREGRKVNAKSIMGIMSLAIGNGVAINVIVDGRDEQEAMAALEQFITKGE
ncbi:HPr family phosphocarrier protein [Bacillus alkalicellulosilyticus]|uniref:HPr family phosphocarrier protein n=1 Tax=Alkalihalobacterium alkalicellulosilyticum TaxID=1912214 RepID=UPI0009966BFE|nr:HPr family phosphocarrier protein [Bacillus alkalicellulosilyticus]